MIGKIYLVGGAVRDELLGLPIQERDWVVVGSTPDEMLKQGFQQVGRDFPVFIHPTTGEEYALARTERKTGTGYTGFQCYSAPDVTLEDDLKRRDFTINAIAKDESGQLIDPFHGQQDLQRGLLRHVSAAFIEDPLRILRGARFLARFDQLIVADDTLQLIKKMVASNELNHLVPERIWKETERSLASDYPARFFRALYEWGALAVLFPEIEQLFGVPQDPTNHPEKDTGVHVMMVLEQAAKLTPDPMTRFAALMHDLGKGITPKAALPKHPHHEEKGVVLLKALCQRLKVPNDYRELAEITTRFHGDCHRALELNANEIVILLEKTDAFRRGERFEKFLLACEADSRGRTGFENTAYPQRAFLQKALARCKSIDIQPLIASGLKGTALANAIRDLRIAAVRESGD